MIKGIVSPPHPRVQLARERVCCAVGDLLQRENKQKVGVTSTQRFAALQCDLN